MRFWIKKNNNKSNTQPHIKPYINCYNSIRENEHKLMKIKRMTENALVKNNSQKKQKQKTKTLRTYIHLYTYILYICVCMNAHYVFLRLSEVVLDKKLDIFLKCCFHFSKRFSWFHWWMGWYYVHILTHTYGQMAHTSLYAFIDLTHAPFLLLFFISLFFYNFMNVLVHTFSDWFIREADIRDNIIER